MEKDNSEFLFGSDQYNHFIEKNSTYSKEIAKIADEYLTETSSPNLSYFEQLWKEGR